VAVKIFPLLFIAGAILSGCATMRSAGLQPVERYLPAHAKSYFSVSLSHNRLLATSLGTALGIDAAAVKQLIERSESIAGSVDPHPDGPAITLVARGRYPRAFLRNQLTENERFAEQSLPGIRTADGQFWVDRQSGFNLLLPDRNTLVATNAPPSLPRAAGSRRAEIEALFSRAEVVLKVDQPGAQVLSGISGAAARLPIESVTLYLSTVPGAGVTGEPAGSKELWGRFELATERDAKAFNVLSRLLFVSLITESGADAPSAMKRIRVVRNGTTIRFSGIFLEESDVVRLLLQFSDGIGRGRDGTGQ